MKVTSCFSWWGGPRFYKRTEWSKCCIPKIWSFSFYLWVDGATAQLNSWRKRRNKPNFFTVITNINVPASYSVSSTFFFMIYYITHFLDIWHPFFVLRYNSMIYEALSTLKEPNGSDSSALANFIEVWWNLDNLYSISKFASLVGRHSLVL